MTEVNPIDTFPYEHFCNYFPQLSPDKSTNTPEFLYACGERALMYLSDYSSAWLHGKRRTYALCLLTAHIVYVTNKTTAETSGSGGGEAAVGPVTSTSVGGVSISMQTPPMGNEGALEWWLCKSPYGQEYLALIKTRGPMMATIGSRTPILPLR